VSPPPRLLADELSAYRSIRRVPGVVAGIVRDGRAETWGFGSRAKGADTGAPDARTLFEIGSITKVFTAIALARLAEEGRLSLDQPIRPLLEAQVKLADWKGREVTLEHLATHTATLPRASARMLGHARRNPTNPYRDYTVEDLHSDLAAFVPGPELGRAFDYSNFGYGVLGHLLALVAGEPYEPLVTRLACAPLALPDTVVTLRDEQRARLLPGHFFGRPIGPWDMPVLAGAGALRSTAADMLRLVECCLGGPDTALSEVLAETFRPRVRASGTLGIGLAWHRTAAAGGDVVWHRGETGGMRGFIGFVRERALGLVLLANASAGLDELGVEMLQKI
jgi:serine-type D-Ala-D-Ala carboxypeptidase/endopeptidase